MEQHFDLSALENSFGGCDAAETKPCIHSLSRTHTSSTCRAITRILGSAVNIFSKFLDRRVLLQCLQQFRSWLLPEVMMSPFALTYF